jgi:hypothetical protein
VHEEWVRFDLLPDPAEFSPTMIDIWRYNLLNQKKTSSSIMYTWRHYVPNDTYGTLMEQAH